MDEKLYTDFWNWRLSRSPEFASLAGVKKYDNELEIFTVKRFEEDVKTCQIFLKKSEAFTDLNAQLFRSELLTFINGASFNGYFFPICNLEGVQVDFERIGNEWMHLTEKSDYVNLIERYNKFPKLASEIIDILRLAVKSGLTYHAISMSRVLEQLSKIQNPWTQTSFWVPFKNATVEIQELAKKAICESIQPGFLKIQEFIQKDYKTRPEIAASSLPNGNKYYEALLSFHTSTNLSPLDIHSLGLKEIEKIEEKMKEIIKSLKLEMTIKEFAEYLRNNSDFFYKSPEELLSAFKDAIFNKINPILEKYFWKAPKLKLDIVETSESQADGPAAFYIAGTADGSRPGRFYVNTHHFQTQPKYEVMSLALHEGNPGHHLQSCFLMEQSNIPLFRQMMEDRIYTQAPSRFPINTAFVEGWALYCENLGGEMGLYTDIYDQYGHYSEDAFRACRLVVDTGIHALGWTRTQALDYMLNHTAASRDNIEKEIDRYISWPGQATAYMIGKLKILSLRQKAETALGSKFDIRDFHQVILLSAGPLYIVEQEVDAYIQKLIG